MSDTDWDLDDPFAPIDGVATFGAPLAVFNLHLACELVHCSVRVRDCSCELLLAVNRLINDPHRVLRQLIKLRTVEKPNHKI